MCKEQKSGAWGAVECAMDVLTTFWYKNQSKCVYNSAYHINDDNWSICVVLRCSWVPEYSEFWLSSIPTAAGVLILDWENSQNLQWFWHRIVFYQQLVEFFAVHQINHHPIACCEHNQPHNLLGQWFIWWMVLMIQSSNSTLVPESLIQLLLPSHRRSNLKSDCLSCMYNWHRYKFIYRKIKIKITIIIMIIIMIINRPSASNRASSLPHSLSTDYHNYLIWAPLHSTCTCVGIHCTPVWRLTFSSFRMITSCSILYVNKY